MGPIWIIVVLTVIGLGFIALEFFTYGFILGGIGAVLILTAVVVCYVEIDAARAAGLFILEVVLSLATGYAAIRYGPKSLLGRITVLEADQRDQRAGVEQPRSLVGRQGVADSLLRPSGVALVDGKRLDVIAESALIERGSAIKVVAVEGSQIIVRKL